MFHRSWCHSADGADIQTNYWHFEPKVWFCSFQKFILLFLSECPSKFSHIISSVNRMSNGAKLRPPRLKFFAPMKLGWGWFFLKQSVLSEILHTITKTPWYTSGPSPSRKCSWKWRYYQVAFKRTFDWQWGFPSPFSITISFEKWSLKI